MKNEKVNNFLTSLREQYTTSEDKPLAGKIAAHAAVLMAVIAILGTVVGKVFLFTAETLAALGADNFTTIFTVVGIVVVCSIISNRKQKSFSPLSEGSEPFISVKRELQAVFYRFSLEAKSIPIFAFRGQLDSASIPVILHSDGQSVLLELNKQTIPVGEDERSALCSFFLKKLETLDSDKAALFRGYGVYPRIVGVEDGGTVWRVYVRLL